jgi:hypothetical protein
MALRSAYPQLMRRDFHALSAVLRHAVATDNQAFILHRTVVYLASNSVGFTPPFVLVPLLRSEWTAAPPALPTTRWNRRRSHMAWTASKYVPHHKVRNATPPV